MIKNMQKVTQCKKEQLKPKAGEDCQAFKRITPLSDNVNLKRHRPVTRTTPLGSNEIWQLLDRLRLGKDFL